MLRDPMIRSLTSLCNVPLRTIELLKHSGLSLSQRRWVHVDQNESVSDKALIRNVIPRKVLAPEISMAVLKRIKQPVETALPEYLREIWTTEETWHLATLQTKGTEVLCLVRPAMIPMLRKELERRHSNIIENQTIVITSQDIRKLLNEKELRRKLKEQLRRCETTKDIFRVAA